MATLAGKGALVTGVPRGIGRAIVERLSADGATVVFAYARDQDAAAQTEPRGPAPPSEAARPSALTRRRSGKQERPVGSIRSATSRAKTVIRSPTGVP
jgi:NAD(P)-dependent dehydrogenase (short-subunit alcohol dehydrogenase family)